MDHFNELTPAELERLAILSEELGEAQQIIGKILRHGYGSHNPFDKDKISNKELLEKELGDIQYAVLLLTRTYDLSVERIDEAAVAKMRNISKYLHHQTNTGQ